MRKLIVSLLMATGLSVLAQTNGPSTPTDVHVIETPTITLTNDATSDDAQSWELTLSGSGVVVPKTGSKEFGIDVSLETNPFKNLRSVWVGIEQSLAWQPTVAGASDAIAEYSINVYKNVYFNVGGTAGVAYDLNSTPIFRAGPECNIQWFIGDSAFLYTGVNYHFPSKGNGEILPSLGVGLTF